MVLLMPSEDFPPLAPFPELSSSVPAAAEGVPSPGEPSLLSAAQRRELAFAADLLSSRVAPPADLPPASAADDFLLGGPEGDLQTEDFSFAPDLITEEPVQNVDFLSVPGENGPALPAGDSFNLQSLAASLTAPAAQAAAPSRKRDDWDPPSIPAFPALTTSLAEEPLTTSGSAPPLVPLAPALTPVPPEKQDSFFVTLAPLPPPEPATLFPPSRPVEPEDDFDASLLFPAPVAEPPASQAADLEADPHDRALGAILCGALLLVLGLFLACRMPSLALEADAAAGTPGGVGAVHAGHLRGEMFVTAAGAATCLLLGIGAATLRRWAPPLIHAAGWTALLIALGEMAVATASMFYLASNNTPGDAVPGDGTAIFAIAGIFGVGLPLLLIAVFQRPGVARLCALADPRVRWTDDRSIPALMVFVAGLTLAAAAVAMSAAGAAFPAFGNLTSGDGSAGAWAGVATAAIAAGVLSAAGQKAGWWLLTGVTCALTAALLLTCQQHGWEEIFHTPPSNPASMTGAVLAAATMLPLGLIVFLTRRTHGHAE
jgi:hypothetical protein